MTQDSVNPYTAPTAEVLPPSGETDRSSDKSSKLYTPMQVKVGSFVFGPFAALWFLRSNFIALGMSEEARKTTQAGILICGALLAFLPFLPERFPKMVVPIAYTVLAGQIAEKHQLSKPAILESDRYSIQSNWLVTDIGLLAIATFFLLAVALVFLS